MGTIRKRGDTWSYRVDLGIKDGKRVQKEKGGFKTKKAAQVAMAQVVEELNRTGEYVENQKITMQQLYEEFIKNEAPHTRKYATIVRYKSLYNNHIEKEFAPLYLYKISSDKIQRFLNYKCDKEDNKAHKTVGLSNEFVRSIYNFLLVLFRYAIKMKYIKKNPMVDVSPPASYRAYGDIKSYSEEELEWMNDRFKHTNLYTAYMLGINLGVRVGECFALRFSDINWEKETIRVDKQLQFQNKVWSFVDPKTANSVRTIKMNHELVRYLTNLQCQYAEQRELYGAGWTNNTILDRRGEHQGFQPKLIEVDDFINIKPNGEMLRTNSDKVLARICTSEKGIDFRFHNLRHTHATYLAEHGVSPKYVMERLGHGKIEITLRYYTHITDKMHDQVADIIDDIIPNTKRS